MTRLNATVATLALCAAWGAPALANGHGHGHGHDHHHGHGDMHVRVFVADAQAPRLTVFDADADTLHTLDLPAAARVFAGDDAAVVYAFMGAANSIGLIASGLEEEDHGDHAHLNLVAPSLMEVAIEGDTPVHFNSGFGHVAAFFDGSGTAMLWDGHDLAHGHMEPELVIETGIPHHGLALPALDGHLVVGIPAEGERLPVAVGLFDHDGDEELRVACPGTHGSARSGRFAVFGCTDGIAVIDMAAGTGRHIPYPAAMGEGTVRNLRGSDAVQAVLADFGPTAMAIIDPGAEDGDFVRIDLPGPRMAFALSEDGMHGFVLLADGSLHRFSALTGAMQASLAEVSSAYGMERGVVRPMMALAADMLAVTDPASGVVTLVDLDEFEVARRVVVGGMPQSLALVAVPEDEHDH